MVLHVQTTRVKLKGTAATFYSAKSKALYSRLTQLFAARHGGASALIGSLQTTKRVHMYVNILASKLQRAYGNGTVYNAVT